MGDTILALFSLFSVVFTKTWDKKNSFALKKKKKKIKGEKNILTPNPRLNDAKYRFFRGLIFLEIATRHRI